MSRLVYKEKRICVDDITTSSLEQVALPTLRDGCLCCERDPHFSCNVAGATRMSPMTVKRFVTASAQDGISRVQAGRQDSGVSEGLDEIDIIVALENLNDKLCYPKPSAASNFLVFRVIQAVRM